MGSRPEATPQGHCPHLGLLADRTSIFSEPIDDHRCYVSGRAQVIDLQHQAAFCLTSACTTCPRYVAPPTPVQAARPAPQPPALQEVPQDSQGEQGGLRGSLGRASKPQLAVVAAVGLALALVALYVVVLRPRSAAPTPDSAAVAIAAPSATLAPPTSTAPVVTPTPSPALQLIASQSTPVLPPTPTLLPGQLMASLIPAGNSVGWVASGDRINHFGDRNLHAGVFDGQTYRGALQFPLASVPVGSKIHYAAVELMGLSGENMGSGGQWALRLLDPEADSNWSTTTYERVRDAAVVDTIGSPLSATDLAVRHANVLAFSPEQLPLLEDRLEARFASFRIDGPTEGTKNLFTWDTGYGSGFGTRPVLRIVYSPPPTLTPIVITVTPVPANLATAAAQIARATFQAQEFGTPTPFPTNVVTAPPPLVITNTPVPENAATAEFAAIEAQARLRLFGTPTPLPARMEVQTATPIPTPGPTRTWTPPPPTPTATPLPLLIPIETLNIPALTATPIPTITPAVIPDILKGKILFMSDRLNGKEGLFAVNPDGSGLALVTDSWGYLQARELAQYSPDRSLRVFVRPGQAEVSSTTKGIESKAVLANIELWTQHFPDGGLKVLTTGPRATYDPVWSPDGIHVAFVSQESGNDDIYTINPDTREEQRLTNNGWPWDKHPSYSSDGQQIVFWSNRDGRRSLYIMNADGSEQRPLMDSPYNDWDPIWIK